MTARDFDHPVLNSDLVMRITPKNHERPRKKQRQERREEKRHGSRRLRRAIKAFLKNEANLKVRIGEGRYHYKVA